MQINAATRLYLLFGRPVAHSLSPALYNAAFRESGLNCVYLACPVNPDLIGEAVGALPALAAGGANVTSPFKEAVVPYMDTISDDAKRINSVNTIISTDRGLYGTTTDGQGFMRSLAETGFDYRSGGPVLIVGAGGAARAVADALARDGVLEMVVANRSRDRGQALAAAVTASFPAVSCSAVGLKVQELQDALSCCPLVVYSLPSDQPAFLAAMDGSGKGFTGGLCMDLRYNPPKTAVMSGYERLGGRVENGLGMLFWQGVAAFELFSGKKAPLAAMRKAVGLEP